MTREEFIDLMKTLDPDLYLAKDHKGRFHLVSRIQIFSWCYDGSWWAPLDCKEAFSREVLWDQIMEQVLKGHSLRYGRWPRRKEVFWCSVTNQLEPDGTEWHRV